jgi:pSer/pThr/pTyr-binding forkhead associated (FHA) protein
MSAGPGVSGALPRPATLVVVNPSGTRSRVPLSPVPFTIGRQSDNHLVLRDNRASRNHARIALEADEYYLEDLNSSHGLFVNGVRVTKQKLHAADRIEFGFPDSYSLIFTFEEDPRSVLGSPHGTERRGKPGEAAGARRSCPRSSKLAFDR